MNTNNLELLMPAGSPSKMSLALDYGADAVYLGPPLYSLRARDNEFQKELLQNSIQQVHDRNKKVYMTLNIFARNRKLKPFSEDLPEYARMKPDAFIMSDPGMISIARELAPEIPVHLSVQANCMNWRSVKFWKESLGVERIILSRELSVHEISEIKQKVPDIELEAFVHGSICIAYSGRCLLSSYMDRRDANQGVCDNSCREKYKIFEGEFYLEDAKENPGQYFQIDEDEHGTYILNSRDLCMIEHLQELVKAGVISFKVEGRTKSEFYAAMVARAYRGALNDLVQGKAFDRKWMQELEKLTHRGYHTGFMLGTPGTEGQNYQASTVYNPQFKFLGLSRSGTANELWVDVKNKIQEGQKIEIISPDLNSRVLRVRGIRSQKGEEKQEVHSGAGLFQILLDQPESIPANSLLVTSHDEP